MQIGTAWTQQLLLYLLKAHSPDLSPSLFFCIFKKLFSSLLLCVTCLSSFQNIAPDLPTRSEMHNLFNQNLPNHQGLAIKLMTTLRVVLLSRKTIYTVVFKFSWHLFPVLKFLWLWQSTYYNVLPRILFLINFIEDDGSISLIKYIPLVKYFTDSTGKKKIYSNEKYTHSHFWTKLSLNATFGFPSSHFALYSRSNLWRRKHRVLCIRRQISRCQNSPLN